MFCDDRDLFLPHPAYDAPVGGSCRNIISMMLGTEN